MFALGTIVETPPTGLRESELGCRILDFYDRWDAIDPAMREHHDALSRWSEAIAHDIVDCATYSTLLIEQVESIGQWLPRSLPLVGSVAQAMFVSIRSACDAVAEIMAAAAGTKLGQAPRGSLHDLQQWARKHPTRVRPSMRELLTRDLPWFDNVKTIRDYLVHDGCHANIASDGLQFNLWVHHPRRGWVVRTPLLPLLGKQLAGLLGYADDAGDLVRIELGIPDYRRGCRVVSGVMVHSIRRLWGLMDQHSRPDNWLDTGGLN